MPSCANPSKSAYPSPSNMESYLKIPITRATSRLESVQDASRRTRSLHNQLSHLVIADYTVVTIAGNAGFIYGREGHCAERHALAEQWYVQMILSHRKHDNFYGYRMQSNYRDPDVTTNQSLRIFCNMLSAHTSLRPISISPLLIYTTQKQQQSTPS